MFVGHPTSADVNIPFALLTPDHSFDAKKGSYQMKPNPLFAGAMQSYLDAQNGWKLAGAPWNTKIAEGFLQGVD